MNCRVQQCTFAGSLVAILCIAGCGGAVKHNAHLTGRATLGVSIEALSAAQVNSITVTVTPTPNPGGLTPIVQNLANTAAGWTGVIGEIPTGPETFSAVAFDNMGTEIFDGSALVTIQENTEADVVILMQQFMAPAVFSDTAPLIDSVTASSEAVGPGDTIALNVVMDATDSMDVLTYAWTATGGTFLGANTPTATWTAPASQGNYNITITVTDSTGAFAAVTLANISDETTNQTGSANLEISFNVWPVINSIVATPARVDVGQTTALVLSQTSNPLGVPTYSWADSCGGNFNSLTVQNPTWTAPAAPPATKISNVPVCTLTVTVDDGLGGSNTGSLTIQVAPPVGSDSAPVFTQTFQDSGGSVSQAVAIGATVNFNVTASDPQGGALTWAWSFAPADGAASIGTVGNGKEVDTNTTSSNQFVAGSNQSTYTVTVTATDPAGLSTSYTFTVNGLG